MSDLRLFQLSVLALAAALGLCSCNLGGSSVAASTSPTRSPTSTVCGTYSGKGCAPASERVDLERPTFTHPTEITNPLFPISNLKSALLLGHVSGKPFRTETTLLPGTTAVAWDGRVVRVLVSQYMAYLDGRLEEVALDRYAQADDGSVWYFGEDVFDYRHGAVAMTEGTWLAGREGPAAMIMPGDPQVGDVYRTENVPGIVFEEVTVDSIGKTVEGPAGPIQGAMIARELHSDGTSEDKIFAPRYGEFRTSGGGDLEALALAVPVNALPAPEPVELRTLTVGATAILEAARVADWEGAAATMRHMNAAWSTIRSGSPPPMVSDRMGGGLKTLAKAVNARRVADTTQAAIDVGQSALDLELRYRAPVEINADRFVLWTQQLRVDAAKGNLDGVTCDVAVLEWIRDRITGVLTATDRSEIDSRLRELRSTADARNLPSAADQAARLAARLRSMLSTRLRLDSQ